MGKFVFAYPAFFYGLILIPLMAAWYLWKGRKGTAPLTISGFENLDERMGSSRIWMRHILRWVRQPRQG